MKLFFSCSSLRTEPSRRQTISCRYVTAATQVVTANAELLFYDGKSLNGAHSAECAMRLVHKQDDRFDVTQTCPAEHVAIPSLRTQLV
jgi:hypothetical protein